MPKRENGQVILEFAIVMPMVLFITMGFVQLALIITAKMVLDYASFAATRAALVGKDPHVAASLVMTSVSGPTQGDGPAIAIEVPGWGELPHSQAASSKTRVNSVVHTNQQVTVAIEHDYELLFPEVMLSFFGISGQTFIKDGASFLTLSDTYTIAKQWPEN